MAITNKETIVQSFSNLQEEKEKSYKQQVTQAQQQLRSKQQELLTIQDHHRQEVCRIQEDLDHWKKQAQKLEQEKEEIQV
jgi:hypothetical protein